MKPERIQINLDKIATEKKELQEKLNYKMKQIESVQLEKMDFELVKNLLENFNEVYEDAPKELRKRLVRSLIKEVQLGYDDKGKVVPVKMILKFSGEQIELMKEHKENFGLNEAHAEAVVIQEVFTGTNYKDRKRLKGIVRRVKDDDTIVFDSVSRMSRNAKEGFELYEELFNRGIHLVFLKEPHINTDVYRRNMNPDIQMTGEKADILLEAVKRYLLEVAKDQIRIAFEQSEKEVMDLRQRTKEGIETARLNGKQIGQVKGAKLETKKSIEAKELIKKHSRSFDGNLNDKECMKLAGVSRNTFYKYKRELLEKENICEKERME